jgi:hypothetical protein
MCTAGLICKKKKKDKENAKKKKKDTLELADYGYYKTNPSVGTDIASLYATSSISASSAPPSSGMYPIVIIIIIMVKLRDGM